SCEGTALSQVSANTGRIYFQGTIPSPSGRSFACTYTGQGQTVDLALAAASPLLLTAPTSGSVVARVDPLTLTFSDGQPAWPATVEGGAPRDAATVVPAANALAQLARGPNTGSMTLAPSLLATLRVGDGFLAVSQTYSTPIDGTPFKSAQADYATA